MSAKKGDGNQLDTAIGTLQQSAECNPIPLKGAPIAYLAPTIDGQLLTPAVDGQLLTPGFIKTLSDPSKERPGICLEVNLGNGNSGLQPTKLAQVNLQPMGPLSHSSPTAEEAPQSKTNTTTSPSLSGPIRNRPKKWKRKGSRCDKIKHQLLAGRFSRFTRRMGHKGASTSKGIIKGAKSRSSAEPISSNSVFARDILQEAHATLQVGESLGFDFKGQEAEVIQKLTHMDEQDKERLVCSISDEHLCGEAVVLILMVQLMYSSSNSVDWCFKHSYVSSPVAGLLVVLLQISLGFCTDFGAALVHTDFGGVCCQCFELHQECG
ncbi:hypothetical protein LOK49_LG06G00605 [Camellia lanceoleosa]|uniref:Uncharacterized protein n=1 Tax=Camellia lanceoleosa TaxID=1840588 RepID=A0ACC0HCK0_9ERIC|nr:hypothetical protein LOK49_LG06G00605 [Camellia lanceoleosa]